ncbi:hypothetical protein LCGC14_2216680 [marine sediment metagenome]|uniref:Uncharacterized protein n=1 Tax=marine sediment metagenome TaxID=412755 RepID=A0A0F9G7V0_9ZZZZ
MRVPFPIKGINKGRTTADQPGMTSPAMKNMRPYDTLDNRARGGQRPGQDKRYSQQIGGEAFPIVAICTVTVVD